MEAIKARTPAVNVNKKIYCTAKEALEIELLAWSIIACKLTLVIVGKRAINSLGTAWMPKFRAAGKPLDGATKKTELNFSFDNSPRKFIDLETGEEINLFAENTQEAYNKVVQDYFKKIETNCMQYQIRYVPVSVDEKFEKIMTTYLVEKQKFG